MEDNHIKIMSRKASDNKYLHKDFHLSMNLLLDYIYKKFGKEELIRYLEQYTVAYHQPLKEQMKAGNMNALTAYFTDIYGKEEWPVAIKQEKNYVVIEQHACPGISYIRKKGGNPCSLYIETYKTVYSILCKDTPFEYFLEYFDQETGACKQIFKRKETLK